MFQTYHFLQNTVRQWKLHKSLPCSPGVTPISQHNISNRICSMGFACKSAVVFFFQCFLSDIIIKASLPHIEVSYLNVFWSFVILQVLWLVWCTGVGNVCVQYRCFFFFFSVKSDNRSDNSHFNQPNSLAPSLDAIISTSVFERAVAFCSRIIQDTAQSADIAITPMVNRLVTLSPAKSASLKTFSSPKPLVYLRP